VSVPLAAAAPAPSDADAAAVAVARELGTTVTAAVVAARALEAEGAASLAATAAVDVDGSASSSSSSAAAAAGSSSSSSDGGGGDADADLPEPGDVALDAATDTARAEAIIARWQERGLVYRVPPGSNDDWYWLYAAVYSQAQPGNDGRVALVSNDLMRDHHFAMLAPKDFLTWRERHQVRFRFDCFWDRAARRRVFRPVFDRPATYSHRAQVSEDGAVWHFPVAPSEAAAAAADGAADPSAASSSPATPPPASGTEWLVAWRTDLLPGVAAAAEQQQHQQQQQQHQQPLQ
jgi:proteinaceous RNase P